MKNLLLYRFRVHFWLECFCLCSSSTYLHQVSHQLSSQPCWIRAEEANSHEVEDVPVQRKARTEAFTFVPERQRETEP